MRRALATAILVWVAAWPLAHRAAVSAFDINPWKLGGFAMYTTATPPVQVVPFEDPPGDHNAPVVVFGKLVKGQAHLFPRGKRSLRRRHFP